MPTSDEPVRPYHHGRLRESLVDAALALARAGGPEAVVLRVVSRQAGVSHNAAYRHFADHEELLVAVSARCMEQLARLMVERMSEVRIRDEKRRAWARLAAIGRAYIEFARAEPGWFRTAFTATAPRDAAVGEVSEPSLEPGPYELLSARLDELVEVGALPGRRRPGAETAAWSMVHGLSTLLVDGPLRQLPEADVDATTALVIAVVERGL